MKTPNPEKAEPISIESECLLEQSPFKFYLILICKTLDRTDYYISWSPASSKLSIHVTVPFMADTRRKIVSP